MLESLLNPIFDPLLRLQPLVAIILVAFFMSLIITLINRWMTDQKKMKEIKEEGKAYQKEMKALKDNPKKMMEVQKKAMGKNAEYMRMSFKPMLITFIPIIIIFGWLNANMAFVPARPGEVFSTTVVMNKGLTGDVTITLPDGLILLDNVPIKPIEDSMVTWELKGELGDYFIDYTYQDDTVTKEVSITNGDKYKSVSERADSTMFKELRIDYEKVKPFGSLSIFGWKPGWLGTYIIFSLIFGLLLRKFMKVY
ncbi:MAG: DUF106 domain-containing protein [Nanoarchaeota archaeon]|nr:DUF106 domain-containing protein [Nanoarchaeota archaeon]